MDEKFCKDSHQDNGLKINNLRVVVMFTIPLLCFIKFPFHLKRSKNSTISLPFNISFNFTLSPFFEKFHRSVWPLINSVQKYLRLDDDAVTIMFLMIYGMTMPSLICFLSVERNGRVRSTRLHDFTSRRFPSETKPGIY
jgi:hypothetical protein